MVLMSKLSNIDRKRIIVIVLVVVEFFLIFLSIKSYNNKNLDKYVFGINQEIDKKMMAIMLEIDNEYEQSNLTTFPDFPYIYNQELSVCEDASGNKIENAIIYDEDAKKISVSVSKTSMCYFYFMNPKEISASYELINSGDLWSSGLEGDGLRYVGTGAYDSATTPSNFICFGTTSMDECKANEDKYMYRIIGVFPDENGNQHLKLIKSKQLGAYAWHVAESENINWENSDLYNGINGSYFLTNSEFDYLQNSTWSEKIVEWKWTVVNTTTHGDDHDSNTTADNGPNYYNGPNPQETYLHEMNRNSKTITIGNWTYPVAKMGLMYVSDHLLALGSVAKNMTGGTNVNQSQLVTGWIHSSNNDISKSNVEWTIARHGVYNSGKNNVWIVNHNGNIYNNRSFRELGVRPVFYLGNDVSIDKGIGTYTDPYIIKNDTSLAIDLSLNNTTLNINITKGAADLNKYCINNSSNISNCEWKKVPSANFDAPLTFDGIVYVHVLDKAGYIAHKSIKVPTFAEQLIASNQLWNSGLEGDGLRYVGSGAYNADTTPSNFICFGTTSSVECKANESKYMYRIIGVFPDEQGNQHLKLKKFKQLGTKAWHSTNEDKNWGESTLYTELNGSYFLGNTTYSYLQDDIWSDKIVEWKWTAVNTLTNSNSGPNYYNESTMTPANIYLHEMNRSTKTSTVGEWTYPTGKIGLIYASDYVLSLGDEALAITGSTSSNLAKLKTGWLHQSNNDTSKSSYEWTLARDGAASGSFVAWRVASSGNVSDGSVTSSRGVAPVFYLTTDIYKKGGTGTYSDPYTLSE